MKAFKHDRRRKTGSRGPWSSLRREAGSPRDPAKRDRATRPLLEEVEDRLMLDGSPTPVGLTPAQVRHAYGFDRVTFRSSFAGTDFQVAADGRGQTIAIVVAYHHPNLLNDLVAFDRAFNLPDPPSLRIIPQDPNRPPGPDPTGQWSLEAAMDVQWAHAMAPGANIVVVEATTQEGLDEIAATKVAAAQPGVSVVSMSFSSPEYNGETSYDSTYTTPAGHQGVTFVSAAGDQGIVRYPAASPNVLSVGGTNLTLDGSNNILSETAYRDTRGDITYLSGGGVSQYEALPSYQAGVVPAGTTRRATPDVAYNAGSPVAVYDSSTYGKATPWSRNGTGTSAGTPQWAALIAIANQGRALYGLPTLDGPSQTLPLIYSAPSLDFNDVTSGSNVTFSAGPGYDMVTGRGTPKADLVAYSLVGQNFSLSGGRLYVYGDQLGAGYNDKITFGLTGSGGVQVTLNGMTTQFKPGEVNSVVISPMGGTNTVNVEATPDGVPVYVDTQGGISTVNISPAARNLDSIQGNVSVRGGNSGDVLAIYDQNNPSRATYLVYGGTVARPGAAMIWNDVRDIDLVHVYGSNAGATYNITENSSTHPTVIHGGSGDDTFNISPIRKYLDDIQGLLTVWGGDGNDVLNVNDQGYVAHGLYLVTSATITRTGEGTIGYASVETVNLNGGNGGGLYYIDGTPSGTTLAVQGGSGNDDFAIGVAARNLDTIRGDVRVGGASGYNTLYVDDGFNAGTVAYSVTSSAVTRTGAATISYDVLVEGLSLFGGGSSNRYTIENTSPSTPVWVHGGTAQDVFDVSPSAGDLATIQGAVTVSGVGGRDTLNLFDRNESASQAYAVTSSTVSRSGAAPINYYMAEVVNLYGGSGNDTYNIEGTPAGTTLVAQGGAGDDTFNISPTARNLGNIRGNVAVGGGGGRNALNVDDSSNTGDVAYSLTMSTVTRTGAGTVSYDSLVQGLTLAGGGANNVYNIESTSSSTPVNVKGGGLNDAFEVSWTARDLDTIAGPLTIAGGGGRDSMDVLDNSHPGAAAYAVTSSSINRAGAAPIRYASLASLALYGGSGNDIYNIESTGASTPVNVNAGVGVNAINVSPTARNLGTIQGNLNVSGSGTIALVLDDRANTAAATYSLVGSASNSIVTRTGAAAISYSSFNSMVLNGGGGNDAYDIQESGPISIVGGNGNDRFKFGAGAAVMGKIDGGGGSNWLDYAAYATPVAVNLATSTATGVGGGIANIRDVRGGQGGNTLNGNALGNILIGGDGSDTIIGGGGRSILIGGRGADFMVGGSGDDIVIGGFTDYDAGGAANDQALMAILAEWQSADPYLTRIAKIKVGVGGARLAFGTTVHDDGYVSILTGGAGTDWFFLGGYDVVTDPTAATEKVN